MEYMKKKGAYDNKGKESNKIRQLKKPSYTNQKEWIKVLIVGGEFPKKKQKKANNDSYREPKQERGGG